MPTSSKVSNQSNRASAILKVVAIYLLTFAVLILLFNTAKKRKTYTSNAHAEAFSEKYDQAKKNEVGLSAMIGLLDSIVKMNKELQALDKKEVEQVESAGVSVEIDEVKINLRNLLEELIDTGGNILMTDRAKAKEINSHLRQSSDVIRSLRKEIVAEAKKFEEKMKDEIDKVSVEKEQLSNELDDQGGQLSNSSQELSRLQEEIRSLREEAMRWTTFKAGLVGDLDAMKMKIDEQLNGTSIFNNRWRDFAVDLKGDVRELSIKLEQ